MTNQKNVAEKTEISIGIIGSEKLLEQVKTSLRDFPNFKPIFKITHRIDDIIDLTVDLMDSVEVIMFTDYHTYDLVQQKVDFTIPVHHMPVMGTGLYRSLSIIKNQYDTKSLSVDTFEKQYVEQIIQDLFPTECDLHVFSKPANSLIDIENIINFHVSNHKRYETIALTGNEVVAENLSELAIPYEWVTPTKQDMINSLERALLSTETRKNKEAQIVLGYIHIDNFREQVTRFTSEHDLQIMKLRIKQMLLNYIKQLDGHLADPGGQEYSFITTRGIFERETRGYKFMPLLQESKSELGITFSMGVGFGLTAAQAGNHARLALQQAKDLGGDVCYIVREDRSVIGPVDIKTDEQYEKYSLSITEPHVLERAEKAGMSASYMTRLMSRVSRHQKIDYTAQELAATLKVTVRSAHRILLKWMDAGLVDIIGEEKVSQRGRPSRIYRLTFIKEEDMP